MNQITKAAPVEPSALTAASPATEGSAMLSIIARAASDPAVDVTKMQALLDMQERIVARQAEAAFNGALARLTAVMPRVKKNGRVELGKGGGGYDFAKWEDMDSVIRPLMRQEGFTLSFNMTAKDGGGAIVRGTLLHADGHSRYSEVPLALDSGAGRNNLQAMGSTLSYGKRYTAEMLLNIVREGADDDGEAGGSEYIGADEAAQIRRELAGMKVNADSFARAMGVGSIEQIKASDFRKALNMIASRRQSAQAGP